MTPPTLTPVAQSIVAQHSPYGISTGFLWNLRDDWTAQTQEATRFSRAAVELSALSEEEVEPLLSFLGDFALPFGFTSVHGPAKNRRLDEERLVKLLAKFWPVAKGVVMHPDTMVDLDAYTRLGDFLVIENMDARKTDGRTAAELRTYFEALPDARFCFDVAHAWSIDPSMKVAEELLDEFGSRLSHVHISSLDGELHHVALTSDDESLFAPLLKRCPDVPWILEARPPALH